MTTLFKILALLPELIELIKSIQKSIDEQEAQRKLRDDIKTISQAFKSKDASELDRIFNSK